MTTDRGHPQRTWIVAAKIAGKWHVFIGGAEETKDYYDSMTGAQSVERLLRAEVKNDLRRGKISDLLNH
jgi:hypothetical protein